MKPKKWKYRENDAIVFQFSRQLAVGLITGGIIGLAFTPTTSTGLVTAAAPIVIGTAFAVGGLLERRENSA